MNASSDLESLTDILEAARSAGYSPSDKQRKDWRRVGLLSTPVEMPGRGRGIGGRDALYPAGTTQQLLAICRHSRPKKPFPLLAFLVWWDGVPVPNQALARTAMVDALDGWERLTLPWASFHTVPKEQWDALDRELRAHLPEPLHALRSRLGKKAFLRCVALLLSVAAGSFSTFAAADGISTHELSEDAEDYLGLGAATWLAHGLEMLTPELNATLQVATLRASLDAATDHDLMVARDEVRAIMHLMDDIGGFVTRLGGDALAPFRVLDSRTFSPGLLAFFLVFWLSARQRPMWRNGMVNLVPLAQVVRMQLAVMEAARGKSKSPRE